VADGGGSALGGVLVVVDDELQLAAVDAASVVGRLEVGVGALPAVADEHADRARSEEHTSELQSQSNLVCRLLLEKKKKKMIKITLAHIHGPGPDSGTIFFRFTITRTPSTVHSN